MPFKNNEHLVTSSIYEKKDFCFENAAASSSSKCSTADIASTSSQAIDFWELPELKASGPQWNELSSYRKFRRVLSIICRLFVVFVLLYCFVCSLGLMSSAFRLIGGKAAGETFTKDSLLANPIAGLMVGVIATVLVQSSSTSTSIVVSMVANDVLLVETAIPIIMGANIGTSVTNTIVSIGHIKERSEFRRSFAGATIHDMFNWLTVICLLPVEVITGYLFKLSSLIIQFLNVPHGSSSDVKFLSHFTKPATSLIVQIDSKNILKGGDEPILKTWCEAQNETSKCPALFSYLNLNDTTSGIILLVLSLFCLCACLIVLVKVLQSIFRGHVAGVIRNTANSNFPGVFGYFTGYIAIIIGAIMTILVQSSSVFTSTLTPLVGIGVVRLDRMYPLTLGSNIGTTVTGLLAALASDASKIDAALQIALCHLLFNFTGILIWYPLPFMRNVPLKLAKTLGETTAKYRWFSILYLVLMFFILPGFVFILSYTGNECFFTVSGLLVLILALIISINLMQNSCPQCLPHKLRNWEFLPLCFRSLKPIDSIITKVSHLNAYKLLDCCSEPPIIDGQPDILVIGTKNKSQPSFATIV